MGVGVAKAMSRVTSTELFSFPFLSRFAVQVHESQSPTGFCHHYHLLCALRHLILQKQDAKKKNRKIYFPRHERYVVERKMTKYLASFNLNSKNSFEPYSMSVYRIPEYSECLSIRFFFCLSLSKAPET